jgi:hypothetical protein
MTTKNIFAGVGVRTTFVNILYDELMKREFVTLADVMCIKRRLPKGYYDNNPKATLSSEMYYGDLKKASSEVVEPLTLREQIREVIKRQMAQYTEE